MAESAYTLTPLARFGGSWQTELPYGSLAQATQNMFMCLRLTAVTGLHIQLTQHAFHDFLQSQFHFGGTFRIRICNFIDACLTCQEVLLQYI